MLVVVAVQELLVVVVMVHELPVGRELPVLKELLVVEWVEVEVALVWISTLKHHVRASMYCVPICHSCFYAKCSNGATCFSYHHDNGRM